MPAQSIAQILGDKADYLLQHSCKTIDKSSLHLPSPDHVDQSWINSNRSNQVLRSLQTLLNHGRKISSGWPLMAAVMLLPPLMVCSVS
jgi:class I fructose-bisphosphate aldolase